MKERIKVWTLSWDDEHGTDCRVFGSEAEWLSYFNQVILNEIADLQTPAANAIRDLLSENEIGDAYDLWQATHKDELDTYNWGFQEIEVELQSAIAG